MKPVRREELLDLTAYEKARPELRQEILALKAPRRVHVGEVLTFLFENTATIRYQIQEMLRAERIVNEPEIAHELETYNEVLGGDGELGCALLIEIDDPRERDRRLRDWLALPQHLYVETESGKRVRPTFDPRQVGGDRLSSVQYLKFDTGGETPVKLGVDLPALSVEASLNVEQRAALAADLAGD
jgi:hypothetical protein